MSSIAANHNQFNFMTLQKSSGAIFHFVLISFVCMIGTSDFPSTFTNNTGSVVVLKDTDLYLFGNIQFSRNYGNNGAAISIFESSCLYFAKGANILFENNLAQLSGGAIFSSTWGYQSSHTQFLKTSHMSAHIHVPTSLSITIKLHLQEIQYFPRTFITVR